MYCLFCVVLCIVCVQMCTVLLPPGGYPIAVNKYTVSFSHYIHWAILGPHSIGCATPLQRDFSSMCTPHWSGAYIITTIKVTQTFVRQIPKAVPQSNFALLNGQTYKHLSGSSTTRCWLRSQKTSNRVLLEINLIDKINKTRNTWEGKELLMSDTITIRSPWTEVYNRTTFGPDTLYPRRECRGRDPTNYTTYLSL
jgi:hypothetical protein